MMKRSVTKETHLLQVGADKGRHEESRTRMQTQNTNTAHLIDCCGASWE